MTPARRIGAALAGMCLAVLATIAMPASAHKASDAYLTLAVQGPQISQRLDIALRDLDRELALDANDDGQLQWGEVRDRWDAIETLADAGVQLQADGQACRLTSRRAPVLDDHSDGRYAVLQRLWICAAPVRKLTVHYTLFQRSDATHRGIAHITSKRGAANDSAAAAVQAPPQTAVLVPGEPAAVFALQAGAASGPGGFIGFVAEGVHHILTGFDHLLFLLALLLPAVLVRGPQGWRAAPALKPVLWDVLRVVTAFTVAHSITLALAVLDVVNPPSRWVESLIAASVVLAALNNLHPLLAERRWMITFAFGLVHGFGFAGALKDLGLNAGSLAGPLLGFNLGVELGQLALVALFVPLAWLLRPTVAYRRAAMLGGSSVIAMLALVWLAERALNLDLMGWM